MTAILAALPTVFNLISLAVPGVQSLIAWVSSVRTAASQTNEWTPQMETDFLKSLVTMAQSKAWTPDAQLPKV